MPVPSPRRRRAASLFAASAFSLPLLVTGTGHAASHDRTAEPPPPRTTTDACPDGFESPDNAFTDLGATGAHVRAIRCAAHREIAEGGPGGRPASQFGPGLDVRRDQMASFLARLVDQVEAGDGERLLPAWDGVNGFTDVPDNSDHVAAVNRLAAAGIVQGGPGGAPSTTFGPGLGVSRAQTASFLARIINTVADPGFFTTGQVYFDDLGDASSAHVHSINALAEEGLLAGRKVGGSWHFDPGATVRRDQMASLLMRTLGAIDSLDLSLPFVEPGPGSGAERVEADGPAGKLDDVRLARHDGYDRFVLEFEGDAVPAHRVGYVAPPITRDGSGELVLFPGPVDAYLSVDVTGSNWWGDGDPNYTGPGRLPLDGNAVVEAVDIDDFEGQLRWVLGVDTQRPFTVRTLSAPTRLVIDVEAP